MSKIMMLPAIGTWPMLEFELDILEKRLAAGDEVVLLACDGNASFCPANIDMKKRICLECRSRVQSGIKWLGREGKGLTVGTLYDVDAKQREECEQLSQSAAQAATTSGSTGVEHPELFDTVFSTLQTTYKEFRPDIAAKRNVFQHIARDFFESQRAFVTNLNRHQPDEVWVFNGRISRYRPALRECQRRGIKVFTYEYPFHGYKRYAVFEGQYLHDFGFRSSSWKKHFEEYPLSLDKKLAIGQKWLDKRLRRIKVGHEQVFSAWQTQGLLPSTWQTQRYNVSVFNSSEWESAGVPESRRWIYGDQFSALEKIFTDTATFPNIHFTFRIHPHLARKDPESARRFLTLSRFPHVTILPPESKFDTYALVMASDLVLTFYSLVGIESAYLGKPVMCIGPTPYQDFGCVYLPKTHDEVISALKDPDAAKNRFPSLEQRAYGAKAWGFARMFSGTKPKYVWKRNYYRARMNRDGVFAEIRPARTFKIWNRLVSLPQYFVEAVRRIYADPMLKKEIAKAPARAIFRFVRDRLVGTVP